MRKALYGASKQEYLESAQKAQAAKTASAIVIGYRSRPWCLL